MSDPAVEAAKRASAKYEMPLLPPLSVAAAREALEPIRELHKPEWSNCINAYCSGEDCRHRGRICGHCWGEWPCDTAKLVYSTEELER